MRSVKTSAKVDARKQKTDGPKCKFDPVILQKQLATPIKVKIDQDLLNKINSVPDLAPQTTLARFVQDHGQCTEAAKPERSPKTVTAKICLKDQPSVKRQMTDPLSGTPRASPQDPTSFVPTRGPVKRNANGIIIRKSTNSIIYLDKCTENLVKKISSTREALNRPAVESFVPNKVIVPKIDPSRNIIKVSLTAKIDSKQLQSPNSDVDDAKPPNVSGDVTKDTVGDADSALQSVISGNITIKTEEKTGGAESGPDKDAEDVSSGKIDKTQTILVF